MKPKEMGSRTPFLRATARRFRLRQCGPSQRPQNGVFAVDGWLPLKQRRSARKKSRRRFLVQVAAKAAPFFEGSPFGFRTTKGSLKKWHCTLGISQGTHGGSGSASHVVVWLKDAKKALLGHDRLGSRCPFCPTDTSGSCLFNCAFVQQLASVASWVKVDGPASFRFRHDSM